MVEPTRAQLQRACTALVPFVQSFNLPLNPEQLEEIAYAVAFHTLNENALADIVTAVEHQITEWQSTPRVGPVPETAKPVSGSVRELRLAVTVPDLEAAVAFYRDALGLPEIGAFRDGEAQVFILDAGRATVELLNEQQAQLIDDVEVGHRVAPAIRLALEVVDSAATAAHLVEAGARMIAEPVVTPWQHRNVRLDAPGNLQLTLFTVLESA
jgi:lactoylglutathione lyase